MLKIIISCLSVFLSTISFAQQKKNIMVIMVDDLSQELFEDLVKHDLVPNIKQHIMDRGVTFTNSYSTNPVCCPSRATFLTGQYSMNNGVLDVATGILYWLDKKSPHYGGENNTIATWLHDGGYYTGHIGKYLNGYGMNTSKLLNTLLHVPKGYDTWYGLLDPSTYRTYDYVMVEKKNPTDPAIAMYYPKTYANNMKKDSYPTYWYFKDSNEVYKTHKPENYRSKPNDIIEENYQTDMLSKKALTFLKDRDKSKPFYLSLMPMAPHIEVTAIDVEHAKKYGYKSHFREKITPAQRHLSKIPDLPSPLVRLQSKNSFNEINLSSKPKYFDDKEILNQSDLLAIQEQYKSMMAAMLAVDDMVGEVVQKLKDQNQYDNTVIIFTSDNGYMFGEHRLSSKAFAYEESARVPLIIAGQNEKGSVSKAIVLNNDLAPTIADIAGIKPKRDVDGRSILNLLNNKNSVWGRKQFLIEHYLDLESLSYINDIPIVGPWLIEQGTNRQPGGPGLATQFNIPPNDFKAIRRITDQENFIYIETYPKKLLNSRYREPNLKNTPLPDFVELYDLGNDPFQVQNLAPTSKLKMRNWLYYGEGKVKTELVDSIVKCTGQSCQSIEDQ